MPSEFEWIDRYLSPLTQDEEGTFGLCNDGAVIRHAPEDEIVVTSDTLIEGVHFLPGEPPGDIAKKALRVNISDLAAMGARPLAYTLNLSLSGKEGAEFIEYFCSGLKEDQNGFGLYLLGGDTTICTREGYPLTITMTLFGVCQKGSAWSRSGAREGDVCLVTGSIGEAVLGLQIRRNEFSCADAGLQDRLVSRHICPQPRTSVTLFRQPQTIHAAIDVSDGLLADLGHICAQSGVSIDLKVPDLPIEKDVRDFCAQAGISIADLVTGGDDYEVILAMPADAAQKMIENCAGHGVKITEIGRFKKTQADTAFPVRLLNKAGEDVTPQKRGWTHF